jgi:hypothetical protein
MDLIGYTRQRAQDIGAPALTPPLDNTLRAPVRRVAEHPRKNPLWSLCMYRTLFFKWCSRLFSLESPE